MADKFKQISGVMGILEKSPRMMRMLQMGVDVAKAQANSGRKNKPHCKKSHACPSSRRGHGCDQAGCGPRAQYEDGRRRRKREQGTETGVASGVLGGAFGLIGRAAEKAGEAGKAVQQASEGGKTPRLPKKLPKVWQTKLMRQNSRCTGILKPESRNSREIWVTKKSRTRQPVTENRESD